jgi:hypothetical protein
VAHTYDSRTWGVEAELHSEILSQKIKRPKKKKKPTRKRRTGEFNSYRISAVVYFFLKHF